MTALFIHDHPFVKKENEIYSTGSFPANVWERYLHHFDELTVVGRGSVTENNRDTGLVLSNKDNVQFSLFYNIKGGFDYYKHHKYLSAQLSKLIDSHDIVIIRLPSTIGSIAADICFKRKKKYVVEVVGCVWDSNWNYGSLLTKAIAPINFYKTRLQIRKSSAAIYVTEKFLQTRYPSNGITEYASNVQIEKTPIEILDKHLERITGDKEFLRLGLIGNLSVKYKGYDVIFKSLQLLNKVFDNYKLYLVGGGDPAYVKDLIVRHGLENNIVIVGRLKSGDEIFDFLDTLDLYVHPSKQEGLPRAVIEAMSRGCAVLASTVAGIPELIDKKYLHKPGDHKTLYNQLRIVLSDKRELSMMATKNFNKAVEYDIELLKTRRNQFFEKVKRTFDTPNGKL